MPPGTQAEGSDPWGGLAEKFQGEMSIWLSSQPEFTDLQRTVKAMFGLHSKMLWMIDYLLCDLIFLC